MLLSVSANDLANKPESIHVLLGRVGALHGSGLLLVSRIDDLGGYLGSRDERKSSCGGVDGGGDERKGGWGEVDGGFGGSLLEGVQERPVGIRVVDEVVDVRVVVEILEVLAQVIHGGIGLYE